MPTEFNDAQHYGIFSTSATLNSQTGKMVRQSELTLAALRAAGVLDNMEDGTTAPATDKLWLDKNSDPAVLKEYDSISATWQPMTFERLFSRQIVTDFSNVGGTANAITVDEPTVFIPGRIYGVTATAANTGATTLTVTGVGTYDVVYPNGSALAANEFSIGQRTVLLFASGRFEVVFGGNIAGLVSTNNLSDVDDIETAVGNLGVAPSVASRSALKAMDTTKGTLALFDGNLWDFVSGDYSAEVAADVQEGIYIKADDTAAASGAWIRRAGYYVGGADAHWFQLSADGSTSDSAKIQDAIDICALAGIKKLRFREYEYALTSTITVGDGSSTAYSTINGVELIGVGAPFLRLTNAGGPQEDNGTRFKWTGASGGTMVKIAGPSQGNGISNIALNCNSLAAKGLEILSNNRGKFLNLTVAAPEDNGVAIDIGCVAAESISDGGTQTEALSAEGNFFENTRIRLLNTDTTGIRIDGYTGSASNGKDPLRSHFRNTYILARLTGSVCIELGYTDQQIFDGTYISGIGGTPNGNEASIKFTANATVPSGGPFPQTIHFVGHTDTGQNLPIVVDSAIGPGHSIENRTFFDQQEYLRWPGTSRIRTTAVETGLFPKGTFWGEEGLAIHERGHAKNRLVNPTFRHAAVATSQANPPSGGVTTVDGLFTTYNGTVTSTLSRQDFTPGQTNVPYEPEHFMRWAVTAASGQSFMYLAWKIPNVHLFSGRKCSFQAFMKTTTAARSVPMRVEQNFGTGGSPSSAVGFNPGAVTIGTSWAHHVWEITMPSISGKTLGTAGDDYIFLGLSLPIDTVETWEIALPQFVGGWFANAFEFPPFAEEELECRRFVRRVGYGLTGGWISTTAAKLGIDMSANPMFKAPTATIDGTSVTINGLTPGDLSATATLAASSMDKRGGTVDLGNFTGATAGEIAIMKSSPLILSAYP